MRHLRGEAERARRPSVESMVQVHVRDADRDRWKADIEEKLRMLEDSVNLLNQRSGIAQNAPANAPPASAPSQLPAQPDATMTTEQSQQTEQGWEVVMDLNRGPGVVPASCVSEVSDPSPAATRQN